MKQKKSYAAPAAEVVEVRMNGVLCESVYSILLFDQQDSDPGSFADTMEWD